MIKKELTKKIKLIPYECRGDIRTSIKLEYYLTESEIRECEDLYGKQVYGIEIVKKVDGQDIETGTVLNLSCCRESTKGILKKLANNTVTPTGLHFVLDDLIGV